MAIGATRGQVVAEILAETGAWVAAGVVFGLALAWASGRVLRTLLFGVTAADPASWTISLSLLSLTLVIAVLRPAIRAARIDPAAALRAE
jgi:ABC-type antimicrobial peptide transport system permease subunit